MGASLTASQLSAQDIDRSFVFIDENGNEIENGATVVNTTTLAEDVEGYAGPVPLKIFIKKDKVEKIEALQNMETPKYWALIKRDLLGKWNGLAVKKAASQEVDVITGATYTSEAVIENVRRGVEYYNKNGKK